MHRYLAVFFLSTALFVPISVRADDDNHSDRHSKRYYDRDARDWHQWNNNEDHAYHQYLTENNKRDHDFAQANRAEKKNYFKWRHDHPDQNQERR
jgi:hypothetical protein